MKTINDGVRRAELCSALTKSFFIFFNEDCRVVRADAGLLAMTALFFSPTEKHGSPFFVLNVFFSKALFKLRLFDRFNPFYIY
jgi:hypothetical protein